MKDLQAQKSKIQKSTQTLLPFAEVKDGCVVMKDGSLRAVLAVSSTNLALKSQTEQEATLFGYQNFLNALDFPVQILVQSRKLDIQSYLNKLQDRVMAQTNELLRTQTQEYIEFVGKLIEVASIMSKSFYVVVPYSTEPLKKGLMSGLAKLFGGGRSKEVTLKQEKFKDDRLKLQQRVEQVVSLLASLGLKSFLLSTEEVIELLYNSYNYGAGTPIQVESLQDLDLQK